jgi:hypothetical protein
VDITSPEDLRILANRVAQKSIGKSLDQTQLDTFMQAYQAIQQGGARQQIAAAGREGSTIMTAPSVETGIEGETGAPEAFFAQQIRQQMPEEVRARKFVSAFGVLHNMLGGLPGLGSAGTVD